MSIASPGSLLALLESFIFAPSPAEARRIVEGGPELLTEEVDALLGSILVGFEGDTQAVQALEFRRDLLRRCRTEGIAAAFADKNDVPAEVMSILQELNRPDRLNDMPRRVELCRHALRQLDRGLKPTLWAMLQSKLANSLNQTWTGDRAENLERAIKHHNQALEVYTRQADPMHWALTQNNLGSVYVDRIRGERAENLERAIKHFSQALQVYTRQASPDEWAASHYNLALTYAGRVRGDQSENLKQVIDHYNQALDVYTPQDFPEDWATIQSSLAIAYANHVLGDRAENLERAIKHFSQALEVYSRQASPDGWAGTQNNLANAYRDRIRGGRAENLEQAIHHYNQALQVYTRQAFPEPWADTQNNLASAYRERIHGERADNLEQVIYHLSQALEVYTRQADPERWADTQNNLAAVYADRIRGDVAENLEHVIQYFHQALEVFTRQAFPNRWANTCNDLAVAYGNRVRGDRAVNLEQVIQLCNQALEIHTRQDDPEHWAATQNNLGEAFRNRVRGDRAGNLERAIRHYNQALEIYTRQAFPEHWALSQNNLASAYRNRIRGDRAENLEQAIHHYSQALEVRTCQAFPEGWARTINNLANAYAVRIRGNRAENLEQAIHHYTQVLDAWTRRANPELWATIQNNLANAYSNRIRGEREENLEQSIHHYTQALEVYTRQAFPADWAMTQSNLAISYSDRIRGDRAENLERAIHHSSQALEVYTRQAFPADWAMSQNNLAVVYADRIRGDRTENLEWAVHHYTQALEVHTPQAWPEQARAVLRGLGSTYFTAGDWPAARAAFAQARSLTERFYADALLREVREQEAGTNAAMYARDAFCLAQLGDLPAAWASLEAGRTRALRQGLDQASARRALATASQAVQEQYAELDGRERALRDSLQRPENDPHYQPYPLVRDELGAVTQELHSLQAELLAAAGIETSSPSPEEMQALPLLQDERTGLLSMAVTEHGTLALLLTVHELRHTIVPDLTEADLSALIQGPDEDPAWGGWLGAYLSQFEALRSARDAAFRAALMPNSQEHLVAAQEAHAAWQAARECWRGTISETLAVLGRRLWPDLDGMLQDAVCERIMLVPQGMLVLLPLHACPLKDGQLVGDRYTVAYTPASSILPQLLQEETLAGAPQALIVANPISDLRHTPSEALAVGQTFDVSTTLWEQDATQARLLDAARDADILHISGHGVYDWLEPERSGLILAGESDRKGDLFTVTEMRDELRLFRARLVTLSACETGLVELRRGLADEYLGLPGILLQAGARAVVASLWAVDDLATALLMRRFYIEWQAGSVSIAAALQRAQAWLRSRSRTQVEEALDELDEAWEPWRHQETDPAMRRRAVEQYWEILAARQRVRAEMPDAPFAHPYWWAAFQAVGDVL